MKSNCHAIPAAKHKPMMRRLRSSQRLNELGKTTTSEEAANAINNQGTARRTENWIIDDTPKGLDKSTLVIAITAAIHIGITMSANRLQLLRSLLFRMGVNFRVRDASV